MKEKIEELKTNVRNGFEKQLEAEKNLKKINNDLKKEIEKLKNYIFECVNLPKQISLNLENVTLEQYVEVRENFAGFSEACIFLKENDEVEIDDHGNGSHYYDIIIARSKGNETPALDEPYYICHSGVSSSGNHGYELFNKTSEFILEFDVNKEMLM